MKLVIVESPAKSKTISKYLGRDYTVKASVGHVRDLPKSNKNAIDVAAGFLPHYEISKGKEHVISDLRASAKKAEEVLLATDPDREGEAIAWHVAEALGLKNAKRVVFNEITETAVKDAMQHPRAIDQNLRRAQEARRVLDRLVGYDLSGLIWKKVRYGLSAGRVQSPALRILMEREREIRAFIPEDFYVITADAATAGGVPLTFTCTDEPKTQEEADKILTESKSNPWSVKDVEESAVTRTPRGPFTTSTLQQAASSRLGFTPSRTMSLAQKLYEEGHITYMRTDSMTLAQAAQKQLLVVVEKTYGAKYAQARTYKTKSKNAQEAHEAIRPTNAAAALAGATDEQKRLYRLIWQRTVASQMASAELLRTKIIAKVGDGKTVPDFSVNGSRTVFDGWLKADPGAKAEDVELPKVAAGEKLTLLDIRSEYKQTQPSPALLPTPPSSRRSMIAAIPSAKADHCARPIPEKSSARFLKKTLPNTSATHLPPKWKTILTKSQTAHGIMQKPCVIFMSHFHATWLPKKTSPNSPHSETHPKTSCAPSAERRW